MRISRGAEVYDAFYEHSYEQAAAAAESAGKSGVNALFSTHASTVFCGHGCENNSTNYISHTILCRYMKNFARRT
jgi:hypothetical protein